MKTFILFLCAVLSAHAGILKGFAGLGNGGAMGPLPFSPASIAGITEWLDASIIPGSDGAAIGTWTASFGSNATQATGANKPILKTGLQNGLNVLRYTSAGTTFMDVPLSITGATMHVFLVMKRTVNSADARFLSMGVTGSADFANNLYVGICAENGYASGQIVEPIRNTVELSGTFFAVNTPVILEFKFDGTNSTAYFNSTAQTPVASTGSFGIVNLRIGAALNGGNYCSADFDEVIIYNTALSNTDRTAVENYLSAKWGITIP